MYCKSLRYIANAILLPLQKTCDIDYCASSVHDIGDILNYCPTLPREQDSYVNHAH